MQVSKYLRQGPEHYAHWCPGCNEVHQLPYPNKGWSFNGDVNAPTFSPSFKIETPRPAGVYVCHYVLTAGVLTFLPDCSHALRGPVPLPELPEWLRDPCDWSDG